MIRADEYKQPRHMRRSPMFGALTGIVLLWLGIFAPLTLAAQDALIPVGCFPTEDDIAQLDVVPGLAAASFDDFDNDVTKISLFDISVPENPVLAANYFFPDSSGTTSISSLFLTGTQLYALSSRQDNVSFENSHVLWAFDVNDLLQLTLLDSIAVAVADQFSSGGSLVVQNGTAYMGIGNSIISIDVRTPSNLTAISSLTLPGRVGPFEVSSTSLYAVISFFGICCPVDSLITIDYANATAPVPVGGLKLAVDGDLSSMNISLIGTVLAVFSGRRFQSTCSYEAIDVAVLVNPVSLGCLNLGRSDNAGFGVETLVVSQFDNNVVVYDLSNPIIPVEVARRHMATSTRAVEINDSHLYLGVDDAGESLADADVGLLILGLGTPAFAPAPMLSLVETVRRSSGSWDRIHFARSGLDSECEYTMPILQYFLFRQLPTLLESGESIRAPDDVGMAKVGQVWSAELRGGKTIGELPPGDWEVVASSPAMQQDQNVILSPIPQTATPSIYVLVAQTTTPTKRFMSATFPGVVTDTPAAVASPGHRAILSLGNSPNPFNPSTTIRFELADGRHPVRLELFDGRGRKLDELMDAMLEGGPHEVILSFDGRSLASGVYYYRLQAGADVLTKTLTLLK